jgi:ketosteroid isomerase-like protein
MTSDISRANVSPRVTPDSERGHLQRLMDLEAIRQLGAIFPIFVDSHDIPNYVATFTTDGEFHRAGLVYKGHDEIREFVSQIVALYGVMVHAVHQHAIDIDIGATVAVGVQTGSAEVALEGVRCQAAYRYDDIYRKVDDRWLFARRIMRYQYFCSHDRLASSLNGRDRIRLPGADNRDAEIPEELPTYQGPREGLHKTA